MTTTTIDSTDVQARMATLEDRVATLEATIATLEDHRERVTAWVQGLAGAAAIVADDADARGEIQR